MRRHITLIGGQLLPLLRAHHFEHKLLEYSLRYADMAEAHRLQAARVLGVNGHAHHNIARAGQRGA